MYSTLLSFSSSSQCCIIVLRGDLFIDPDPLTSEMCDAGCVDKVVDSSWIRRSILHFTESKWDGSLHQRFETQSTSARSSLQWWRAMSVSRSYRICSSSPFLISWCWWNVASLLTPGDHFLSACGVWEVLHHLCYLLIFSFFIFGQTSFALIAALW